jgi:hypothetical protein
MQLPCGSLSAWIHARAGMAESARAPPFSFRTDFSYFCARAGRAVLERVAHCKSRLIRILVVVLVLELQLEALP